MGSGAFKIPERLLLAHARGEVLFITGAGISMPAGLPDFRRLVLDVYQQVDSMAHTVLMGIPRDPCMTWTVPPDALNDKQRAEAERFSRGEYDVVLGMLERRIDGEDAVTTKVRKWIDSILRNPKVSPDAIHRDLIRLADRGTARAIVTTNFDRLLDRAAKAIKLPMECYSLGAIPRPTTRDTFAGVFHIHGLLPDKATRPSDLVVSDRDFGEFYLRRRVVPDFIYDAARLFHLVLVGYSANDAPMRYLLNAVAADGSRFSDLKERFAFVGTTDLTNKVEMEDWKGRGITPIPYASTGGHAALPLMLKRWAALSAVNGKQDYLDSFIRRLVKRPYSLTSEEERDLFDHLVRRVGTDEKVRIASLISGSKLDWLDAHLKVAKEPSRIAL